MTPDIPDDTHLACLIAQAFDRLPPPDPGRIADIEARLMHRPAYRHKRVIAWLRYWWLVIALAGAGAATATWWVLDYALEEEPRPQIAAPPIEPRSEIPPESPTTVEQTAPRLSEDPASAGEHEPEQKHGPVIYRRERP